MQFSLKCQEHVTLANTKTKLSNHHEAEIVTKSEKNPFIHFTHTIRDV